MKYELINEHPKINFHDAHVNGVYFWENNMIWELVALQAYDLKMKDQRDDDWYIKNAVMVFENACIENIIYNGYTVCDSDGNVTESQEPINAPPDEYNKILENTSYRHFSEIYGMKELPAINDDKYRVSFLVLSKPDYEITVKFTKSIIKWDNFGDAEWHKKKQWSSGFPN